MLARERKTDIGSHIITEDHNQDKFITPNNLKIIIARATPVYIPDLLIFFHSPFTFKKFLFYP
jgi:hypothetical protein